MPTLLLSTAVLLPTDKQNFHKDRATLTLVRVNPTSKFLTYGHERYCTFPRN